MTKDPAFLLRKKFLNYIQSKWRQNDHDLKDISCVYVMLSFDIFREIEPDLVYVGSTTKLFSRYKSHKVPYKIQNSGLINVMYFLPMSKGFYDYEIKLIKKLQPIYNKQHKYG